MWAYYNNGAQNIDEMYAFNTKEDALKFVNLATKKNMDLYPNDPILWPMLECNDDYGAGMIFKLKVFNNPVDACRDWFTDDWDDEE